MITKLSAKEATKIHEAMVDGDEKILNDKNLMMSMLMWDGYYLQEVSDKLKDDKDVVLMAVGKKGGALEYASDRLKNDKEVVITAVTQVSSSLQFASNERKDDESVLRAVLPINGRALKYASDRLKKDKSIVRLAVDRYFPTFRYADTSLHNDREFIMSLDCHSDFIYGYINLGGSEVPYLFNIDIPICRKLIVARHSEDDFGSPDEYNVANCFKVARISSFFQRDLTFDSFVCSIVEYEDANFKDCTATLRIKQLLDFLYGAHGYKVEQYTINLMERIINFKDTNPFMKKIVRTDSSRVMSESKKLDTIGTMNFKFNTEETREEKEEKEKKRQLKEKKQLEFELSYFESMNLLKKDLI
jgi:hypothetical protein